MATIIIPITVEPTSSPFPKPGAPEESLPKDEEKT